jgi:diguanylate cyclase (GGDEF)-like protein
MMPISTASIASSTVWNRGLYREMKQDCAGEVFQETSKMVAIVGEFAKYSETAKCTPDRMERTTDNNRLSLFQIGHRTPLAFLAVLLCLLLSLLEVAVADSDFEGKGSAAFMPRNVQFSTLSVSDGLSQAAVNSIVQDKDGYLWFATQEGLNRYDGYEIKVYQHDSADQHSLSHDWVWTLFVDSSGSLWIGSDGGGLSRYDQETDRFVHFKHNPEDPKSISNDRVRVIYEDQGGVFWVGTDGGGLNRFNPNNGTFTRYNHTPDVADSLAHDKVMALLEDRAGGLWVGTDGGGLSRFDRESESFQHFQHDPLREESLSDNRVRVLFQEKNGRFWVGTYAGGVSLFNPVDGNFKHFKHDPQNPQSLSHDEVRDIYQDFDGTLWIATDAGLDEWRPSIQGFFHYNHDSTDPSTIASDRVISLYQERGGVLWVGTYGGVSRWNYISNAFTYYRSQPDDKSGLSSNVITGISESPNGMIWIGTYGGGLNRLDPVSGAVRSYQNDPSDPRSLVDNRVMTVFADKSGSVWVGTRNKGLSRLNARTGRFSHFRHDEQDEHSLSMDSVSSIFGEGDGTLWVGTYGGGLNRLDLVSGKFTVYKHDSDDGTTISSNRVLSIYRDMAGALWIGTEDGGLNKFNQSNHTFTHYKHDPKNLNSLGSDTAWDITESRDGSLWIATRDGGLNRWSYEDRKEGSPVFSRFGKSEGLVSNTLHGVLEDEEGALWLSSNRGLSRFNPVDGNVRHFDRMNGLQGNEFNFGARFRTNNGSLIFGGTDGLVMFHPKEIRSNMYEPAVTVSVISNMNEIGKSHSADKVYDVVILDYRDYSVSFEFTALDFISADKNQYRYILEGFDSDWIDSGRFRRASYTNLPAGEYVFKVKASNSNGIWSEDNAVIVLQVTPPPWKSRWAYGAYILVIVGTIIMIVRSQAMRFEQAARQRRELEEQVQLRTQELAERNNELEQLTIQLEKASITDPLTGLNNRRFLHQFVNSEIASLKRHYEERGVEDEASKTIDIAPSLTFIMIDLDGFKPINDTYGHHAGDLALIQVRDILQKCCRKSDTIVRWGGDEFFIVGRHSSRHGAERYAERIRVDLANHMFHVGSGHVARLSGSIGITMFPFVPQKKQQLTWEQVVTVADQAAYLAKENGRNAWVSIYGSRKFTTDDMYERLSTDIEGLINQEIVDINTSIEKPLVYSTRVKQKNA